MPGLLDRVREARAIREYPVPAELVLRRSEWGPSAEVAPPEYLDYLAGSNEVYAAVELRARRLAGLTLRLYRGRGLEREEITDGAVWDLFHGVNPHWTARRLIHQTEQSLCLLGQAFWVLEGTTRGVPREIWWVRPDRMWPVVDPTQYVTGFIFQAESGELVRFNRDEVIWFRYPNSKDEFAGLSPLAAARLGADVASASMKSNKSMFTQGLAIAGIVSPKEGTHFTEDQARQLEVALDRRFRGQDKAHRWGVLRFEANFAQMAMSPKDAEYLGSLKEALRHVARAYGIPPPLLGDMEGATLANVDAYEKQLWTLTLIPETEMMSSEIDEQLLSRLPGQISCAFDLSTVAPLQESLDALWARKKDQIQLGVTTINEVRAEFGQDPVPWGEVWWAPVNTSPVGGMGGDPDDEPGPTVAPALSSGEPEPDAGEPERTLGRLRDSILDRLRAKPMEEISSSPFDLVRWQGELVRVAPSVNGALDALWHRLRGTYQAGVVFGDDRSALEVRARALLDALVRHLEGHHPQGAHAGKPYVVVAQHPACPAARPVGLVATADSSVLGCFASEDLAEKEMAALTAAGED